MPKESEQKFWCETCYPPPNTGKAPAMNLLEMKDHLEKVHQIKRGKVTKKLVIAEDSENEFCNTYEITIGNVKLTQEVKGYMPGRFI